MTLIVPEQFKLAGSTISVEICELVGASGVWDGGKNAMRIDSSLSDQVKVEILFHELSEAISAKFVNEQAGGDPIDHRIIDAYGRGMFDFFVNNVSEILRIEHGKKRSK